MWCGMWRCSVVQCGVGCGVVVWCGMWRYSGVRKCGVVWGVEV